MVPILPGENDTTATQQWPLGGGGGGDPAPKKKAFPGGRKRVSGDGTEKGPLKKKPNR